MLSNVDARQFRAKTKKISRNCLIYMLHFIVIQMSRVNRGKGYCLAQKYRAPRADLTAERPCILAFGLRKKIGIELEFCRKGFCKNLHKE